MVELPGWRKLLQERLAAREKGDPEAARYALALLDQIVELAARYRARLPMEWQLIVAIVGLLDDIERKTIALNEADRVS